MFRRLAFILLASVWAGCVSPPSASIAARREFHISEDTFAFANELRWEYRTDAMTGRTTTHRRTPPPEYSLHCFSLARSARQFFEKAAFAPGQPSADPNTYRRLMRKIVSTNPRSYEAGGSRIVVPGFSNLHDFSRAHERLLKSQCGGPWQSYFQRGHWRMVFPFTRRHQARVAEQLTRSLRAHRLPIVHLVRFPRLTINHALLLFDFAETEHEIQFQAYDPNQPAQPVLLKFNRDDRTFYFPARDYFSGGRLNVYEIYNGLLY